jgi:ketosteroid isomerase-like protein
MRGGGIVIVDVGGSRKLRPAEASMHTNCKQLLHVVAVIAAFSGIAAAQRAKLTPEQQVLATDDRRIQALRRGDTKPLEEIYADDYTLVTATGEIRTKADQLRELKSGELRYERFRTLERIVRMYGDVAIVLSRQDDVIVLRGQRIVAGEQRVTRVYKRMGGKWRVIATHATLMRGQ